MQLNTFIIPILAAAAIFIGCNGQGKKNNSNNLAISNNGETDTVQANAPIISLKDSDTYQFGTIKDGDKVSHEFVFTNSGKTPLIISNVQATCGCTTPEYTKTPINPGGEGTIKVIYNSSGQGAGPKHKTVTVTSNAIKKLIVLNLKGEVK
ncbi:Protein of unknown function [bacterium A37T11]|nr:Protein of unknown function [bacterium A37T11]